MSNPLIVFSAVNLIDGGTLAIAKAAFAAADKNKSIRVIGLVHDKSLYPDYQHVKLVGIPKPKKNWLCRLYFEFFTSYTLSIRLKPAIWFALHDISPRVKSKQQFVYCHNPTPFYQAGFKDLLFSPTVFIFSLLYRFIYGINIKSNKAVFVQQCHIRDYFIQRYHPDKVIVARPEATSVDKESTDKTPPLPLLKPDKNPQGRPVILFYPTLPRTFKNIELLIAAARLLKSQRFSQFEIRITISAAESLYTRYLKFRARGVKGIKFIGRLSQQAVFDQYHTSDALVFPSKLETWGLPLSEAKSVGLPILAANLPYARETLGRYSQVSFFDPESPEDLADQIRALAEKKISFQGNDFTLPDQIPQASNWDELMHCVTATCIKPGPVA